MTQLYCVEMLQLLRKTNKATLVASSSGLIVLAILVWLFIAKEPTKLAPASQSPFGDTAEPTSIASCIKENISYVKETFPI
jgi:hypothetical protein